MKETYNWKSLFAGVAVFAVGLILSIVSTLFSGAWNTAFISVGCSLIASGLVIVCHDFFVEKKTVSMLDEWNITKIFATRAEKNAESDPELTKTKYRIDAVAFGLGSFRGKHTPKVEACLRNGVNIRIITMNPESPYTEVRDMEEGKAQGQTRHSIEKLVEWADKLNASSRKGKIVIKGYSCMTLDFYWRVDNVLYIGPYWYGVDSQQTITYKFVDGGKGFTQYTDYFETLWDSDSIMTTLTKETKLPHQRGKK